METNVKKSVLFITENIVRRYARTKNISIQKSYETFTSSTTFRKLCNEKTEMWAEGINYIYDEFCKELKTKHSV